MGELPKSTLGVGRDLVGAESGYGHETSTCPDGVPVELALLSLLAAFGVAFGILYRALTVVTGRRRRSSYLVFHTPMADMLWAGQHGGHKIYIGKMAVAVGDSDR